MPRYVSASTTQAAVVVTAQNGAVTNTTIPCTSICTGSLSIPAGLANVQMTLEDAGGKALSQGTTPVLIVSGQTNNVRFTLDGVVHSVSLQWVPAVLTSTAATTVALLVNALDVDGNVITYDGAYVDANDNQVVIKLSSPDATVNAALQSYAVSAPGAVITLPYSGESSITVTPTVTSGTVTGTLAGATLYASSLANAVWVPAYPPYSAIYAYVPPYTGTYVAVGASSNGAPLTYMAMDTSGNIFATENTGLGGNGVEEFSPPGYQGVQIISSGAGPIKVSASGYLFFGNPTSNIAIYAPPYTGAAVATIPMNASAVNFALDAAGNLYVPTTSGIAVYRPPYTGSPTTIAAANAVNTNAQTTVSFDGSQNLVANTANQAAGTSVLDIYAPPYTGTPANYTLNASIPP
ncbi:MAG TPA: hypothetical protein VGP41_04485, partial [Candidatus Lustribacter sp.]|nr:hypothetical protein [Candidatus Lustribacter sp.]